MKQNEVLLNKIKAIICEGEKIHESVVFSHIRKGEIVFARQLIMYFAKKHNLGSEAVIGQLCGGFDHASVNHAAKIINNYIDTNPVKKNRIYTYDSIIRGFGSMNEIVENIDIIELKLANEKLKDQISELNKKVKEYEDEIYRLQVKSGQVKEKQGSFIQPYHGYRVHQL